MRAGIESRRGGKRDARTKDTETDSRIVHTRCARCSYDTRGRYDSIRIGASVSSRLFRERRRSRESHSRLRANARRMASTASLVTGFVSVAFGVCMKMMDVSQVDLRYCAFLVCCAPSK